MSEAFYAVRKLSKGWLDRGERDLFGTGYEIHGGPFDTMDECVEWCRLNHALPATVRVEVVLHGASGPC